MNGGNRKGAGRPKGSKNKKTVALQMAVLETGITPLAYLLQVMRDPETDPKDRLSAAIAAAPYVHAKLSAIELSGDTNAPVAVTINVVSMLDFNAVRARIECIAPQC